jgi:hypothetical protein
MSNMPIIPAVEVKENLVDFDNVLDLSGVAHDVGRADLVKTRDELYDNIFAGIMALIMHITADFEELGQEEGEQIECAGECMRLTFGLASDQDDSVKQMEILYQLYVLDRIAECAALMANYFILGAMKERDPRIAPVMEKIRADAWRVAEVNPENCAS